ncbi:N-acetylmuramic acid 6-phosphate etherase [Celerinatantimonas sp. YJH-8]|uniref:N-acetylmuramic acid 6-phosphate etherase n=1 Tax=Celerinatantimonas sp. YJH-8 TaxID=3228714 RepID=UPI0038C04BB7
MDQSQLIAELAQLTSEARNPDSMHIDQADSLSIVTLMNHQDQLVAQAVHQELPEIARAVDAITAAFRQQGRLIYIGAGTSGRLGVLDASECPPTFGSEPQQVQGLIAGGKDAMFIAQEGAEDNAQLGADDLRKQQLTSHDVVVGIAASGRTPYVMGALHYAQQIGATTVALSCNPKAPINQQADIVIAPKVGPEVLTGSTRLKSGTAQKMVLNMLSTASMIQIGKSYQNLMVDLKATNQKLKARALRIIMQACPCEAAHAERLLEQAQGNVKCAILIDKTQLSYQEAEALLKQNQGHLQQAIDQALLSRR